VKPIWDKDGHITEFGQKAMADFERISARFVKKMSPKGRQTVDLEALMHKAVTFKTTMYRVSTMT
jgi:hypothetical protein